LRCAGVTLGLLIRLAGGAAALDVGLFLAFGGGVVDDFAGLDLKGKYAVVLSGAPDGMNSEVAAHLARTSKGMAARQAGAAGYLARPLDLAKLVSGLDQLVRRPRRRRAHGLPRDPHARTHARIGIGLAIALRAAKDGASIAIAAKTAEINPKLSGTIYSAAKEIEAAGGKALPIQCDLRDEEQITA
jgi:hypothetical protein